MPRQNVKCYINSQVERVFLSQYHCKVKSLPYLIRETDQTVCPSDYGGADKGSHQKRRDVSSGVNFYISLMLTIIWGKCDIFLSYRICDIFRPSDKFHMNWWVRLILNFKFSGLSCWACLSNAGSFFASSVEVLHGSESEAGEWPSTSITCEINWKI